jgi:hypothetical protein
MFVVQILIELKMAVLGVARGRPAGENANVTLTEIAKMDVQKNQRRTYFKFAKKLSTEY